MSKIYAHVDAIDLLILSYFDRILCYDKNEPTYYITNINECENYQNSLKKILNGLRKNDSKLLVKLSNNDIEILNSWGHEIYKDGNKIIINNQYGGDIKIPTIKYVKEQPLGTTLEAALKFITKGLKIGSSLGAIAASGGAGGDVIVAIISATINSGLFIQQLKETIDMGSSQNIYLKDFFDIRMHKGPDQVRNDTIAVINRMKFNNNLNQLQLICPVLSSLLDSIATIFGDWVSAFIPDSGGLVGLAVESIISSSKEGSYETIKTIYDKLPNSANKLLENPDELNKFLVGIPQFIHDSITKENNEFTISGFASRFIKSTVTNNVPGISLLKYSGLNIDTQQILDFFNKYYEPQINNAVEVVTMCMPLIFVILTINEFCVHKDKLVIREQTHDKLGYSMGDYITHLKSITK